MIYQKSVLTINEQNYYKSNPDIRIEDSKNNIELVVIRRKDYFVHFLSQNSLH